MRYLRKKIRKLEENNTRQEEKANKENIRKATEKSTVKEKITENTRKEEKIVENSMPMTNEDNLSIEQEKYDESVVLDKFTDQDKLKYLVSCFFSNDDLKNCSRTGKRSCQGGPTARPPLNRNDFCKLTEAVIKFTTYDTETFHKKFENLQKVLRRS